MNKVLLTTPFTAITSQIASHRTAQAIIYADQLRSMDKDVTVNFHARCADDYNDFDEVWVYHGNDWGGSLSFYGGIEGTGVLDPFKKLTHFKGKVYSLGIDFPDYCSLIKQKAVSCINRGKIPVPDYYECDLENLQKIQIEAETIKYPLVTNRLVIGDSHAISLYRPGWTVNSVPFRTLYGALQDGLSQYVDEPYAQSTLDPTVLETYFGAIDIRHHLMRQDDPENVAKILAATYVLECAKILQKYRSIQLIKIYEPLPIENESRKIPNSGYYKGKPYYGSWEERNNIRNIFVNSLEDFLKPETKVKFVKWAEYLKNDKEELDFAHMEKPRSVHLSRASYPFWQGKEWNDWYMKNYKNKEVNTLEDFLDE